MTETLEDEEVEEMIVIVLDIHSAGSERPCAIPWSPEGGWQGPHSSALMFSLSLLSHVWEPINKEGECKLENVKETEQSRFGGLTKNGHYRLRYLNA